MGGRDGRAGVGGGEDHRGGGGLAHESVNRRKVEDAAADRTDDAPAPQRRPDRERGGTCQLDPQRNGERMHVAGGEQQGCDHADRLLPVVVEDASFVEEAATCGVFAYVASGAIGDAQLESAISIVLHRFAEYHDLQGAFGRRAVTERAKGILMERHSIDEETAFRMIRAEARRGGHNLIEIAQAVLDARSLLPRTRRDPSPRVGARARVVGDAISAGIPQ